VELMPGAAELLAALERQGIPRAIATSSGRDFVRDVLGRLDLEPRFQFVLTCDDVALGKPNPEIYRLAAERLRLPPPEVLVLEDSEVGCLAGVAARACVVAVPGVHSRNHEFPGARLVVPSLADRRLYDLLGIE
jgi:HAD superfamily hydrolase (TIGR01509 family)